jgi:hypothetical protein
MSPRCELDARGHKELDARGLLHARGGLLHPGPATRARNAHGIARVPLPERKTKSGRCTGAAAGAILMKRPFPSGFFRERAVAVSNSQPFLIAQLKVHVLGPHIPPSETI